MKLCDSKLLLTIIYIICCYNVNKVALHSLSQSCNHFASNVFKVLTSESSKENIISSPLSLHIILLLLYRGSVAETKEELKYVLNLVDSKEAVMEMKYLFTTLNEAEQVEIEIANALNIDDKFEVKQDFLNMCKDDFKTNIQKYDVKNKNNPAELINSWINTKTRGKITHIINSNDIDEYTKMIIVNALYFKSGWLYPFDSELTAKQKFHNLNKVDVYVPTMIKTLPLTCGLIEEYNANFVKIPYLNQEFEIIIILPKERYGLPKIEKLFNLNVVLNARSSISDIELSLPKFKIEQSVNMKRSLINLGLASVFKETANFSLISNKPLHVSHMLQNLFIEIDETGTEAAGASAAHMRTRRMIVDTEIFTVDHPFLFVLNHKSSNIPLFTGSIRQLSDTVNKDEL